MKIIGVKNSPISAPVDCCYFDLYYNMKGSNYKYLTVLLDKKYDHNVIYIVFSINPR